MVIKSNNLEAIFGSKIRSSNGAEWGITLSPEFQKYNETLKTMIHIFEVTNEEKANQVALEKPTEVEIKTLEEANAVIDEYFEDEYTVYNESLMNANLTQMITNGAINLDEMLPEWTQKQEAEWLYNKGVSGIKKVVAKRIVE